MMQRELTLQEKLAAVPFARRIFQHDRASYDLWSEYPFFDDLPALIRQLYYEQAHCWSQKGIDIACP